MKNKNGRIWLYGIHACTAALKNEERILYEVALLGEKSLETVISGVDVPASKIKTVDKLWFENKFNVGAVHQGIAVQVSALPRYSFEELEEVNTPNQLIIILDQVSDPHNVGAIIRSAAAFGAKALIMTDRNAPEESGVLAKSASGALELVPIIRCTNLMQTIDKLKKIGFWTYGFAENGTTTLQKADFTGKVALILGAEGKGMRRLTFENCDFLIRLETAEAFSTLNVSNAAAIALYSVYCQQQG
ncbi:23S rRNA (guanosine(2251)-2'-O)-methyltransferase RlmB [Candidatus Paracaedibacter symbiosus]|uniref:23S rRNA (guanosine(2251)-2'-O)-methyltransferase RlmB n=1 Tax=Candidatus Paracaedibacter symbiosus TaxID=244582 RepID=UPI00068D4C84|nr:23S rRNA (guanosine(2251)-2'-O)-methyltransferase RlmB [Candidatus Paracaedibacter symbiosus]